MKHLILFKLISIFAGIFFFSCNIEKSPVDDSNRPLIIKTGTIDCDLVESTHVVFNNKVYRYEYVRPGYWNNQTDDSYSRFIEWETGKATTPFAEGFYLWSAFVENDKVYVTAVNIWDGEQVHVFASEDLENWEHWMAFELPGYGIFNTTMTKAQGKYVLMFEIGKPESEAGVRFTARFATSGDMKTWEVLLSRYNYAKDRYTAPHCLRYLDSYYYNFFLERHEGFEMRVVRSKDLEHWEESPLNPVLKFSQEDKRIANKGLSKELQQRIIKAENRNNSDFDFCEFNGRLVINYSWGNQRGEEFLAEASYSGTTEQFLKGWFPE